MAGLVLDSSIALSWCLPDEDGQDQIQETVASSAAIAPAHWPLEVANALLMASAAGASTPISATPLYEI